MGRSINAKTKILMGKILYIVSCVMVLIGMSSFRSFGYDKRLISSKELIQNAHRIESKHVGDDGAISKLYLAYKVIANTKHPELQFNKVFNESKSEVGKIYCLIWFYENNKYLYNINKSKVNKNSEIEIKVHCIIDNYKIKDVLVMIENGELISRLRFDEKNK